MKVRIRLARPNLLAYIHISGLCRNCFMLGRNVHFEVFFLKFNVTISLLFQPFEATFLTNRSFCKWWALPYLNHGGHIMPTTLPGFSDLSTVLVVEFMVIGEIKCFLNN